jgi:hypothetical protein
MTTIRSGADVRSVILGTRVQKATGTLTVATLPLFTIAGGLVAVTSLVGRVTTAITVAGTSKLQHNPTLGTTRDLSLAVDLGTTDTVVGEILVVDGTAGTALTIGAFAPTKWPLIMDTGQIEQVTATGADGAILWSLTYVSIDNGASVVAA